MSTNHLIFGEGFGPNGNRLAPSDRSKDLYNHGFTSGSDSHSNGPINANPNSGSITDQNSGTNFPNGRGSPSTLGSDSFLNRPVNPNSHGSQNGNGKTTGPSNENVRPSILATRRPIYNGSGPNKLIDATNTNGGGSHTHTNSHGTHTPSTDGGSSNGRQSQRHGTGPNPPNYVNTNTGSPDNVSHNKNPPIRSGGYDTSGNGHGGHGQHSDNGKSQTGNGGNGLQPYDQMRNKNPSFGKETSDTFDQTHGRIPSNVDSGGNGIPSSGSQTTDVLSGFRNVFKLPPGLCLVKCDSMKPGQALTSDQIRDAYASSGLNGKQ